jgi:hypothetical protein
LVPGNVVAGLPPFQVPWQSRDPSDIYVNGTLGHNPAADLIFDPMEILQDLGIGLLLLPIVSILPQAATAQFYARKLFTHSPMYVHRYILYTNGQIQKRS